MTADNPAAIGPDGDRQSDRQSAAPRVSAYGSCLVMTTAGDRTSLPV